MVGSIRIRYGLVFFPSVSLCFSLDFCGYNSVSPKSMLACPCLSVATLTFYIVYPYTVYWHNHC